MLTTQLAPATYAPKRALALSSYLHSPPPIWWPITGCGAQLEALQLDRLGVRALPPAVARLTALTALRFRGEASRGVQLAAADVSGLARLRVLDLGANLAEALPQGTTGLDGLEELRAREGRPRARAQARRRGLAAREICRPGLAPRRELRSGLGGPRARAPGVLSRDAAAVQCQPIPPFIMPPPLLFPFVLAAMNRVSWGAVPLSGLSSLRHLDISNNKTAAVHPSLWTLGRLTHLDLSHNSIDRVDPQISALTGLQVRAAAPRDPARGRSERCGSPQLCCCCASAIRQWWGSRWWRGCCAWRPDLCPRSLHPPNLRPPPRSSASATTRWPRRPFPWRR
jgi:hypothetical protein